VSPERVGKGGRAVLGGVLVAVALGIALLAGGCGSSSSSDVRVGGSAYPGIDTANTRHASGAIDSANAAGLEVAWTLPLTAKSSYGSYASTPVISKGVVYAQDLESNVQAIDLESGDVLWEKSYHQPDQGPNGLTVAAGRVYGATSDAAFALDQKTGKQIWSTPLLRRPSEGIDMAPGYHDGLVYVSTEPGNVNGGYNAGSVGILWALDAKTGKKAWHFNTVPDDLWSKQNGQLNSGGGLWYAPSFDGKGNMYFGTGNPAPFPGTAKFPWGSSRPGPDLYTDSVVKLDAKTGKLEWYYQQTPHDIYDWDMQNPPVLVKAGGRELAIGSGKVGVVVALDAKSGKVVWKRSVGIHNGHDNDDLYAMRGEYSKLHESATATVFPGLLGGVIAPIATDGKTLFVPVVNHSVTIDSQTSPSESQSLTGELVALDVASGKVEWSKKFSSAAFGAPTVINDLVFMATFDGTLHAFSARTGGEVWQASLPAGSNSGLAVDGDSVVVPAGIPTVEGQTPELVAYEIEGKE